MLDHVRVLGVSYRERAMRWQSTLVTYAVGELTPEELLVRRMPYGFRFASSAPRRVAGPLMMARRAH